MFTLPLLSSPTPSAPDCHTHPDLKVDTLHSLMPWSQATATNGGEMTQKRIVRLAAFLFVAMVLALAMGETCVSNCNCGFAVP
jgi:hypothetical protein